MTGRPERSIVHVLWSAGVGGVERLVVDLAAVQVERGEAVRIAYAQAVGPFVQQAKNRGLPVVDLGLRSGFDILPRSLARAAEQLGRSDVVHLHGFNLPFAIGATRSGRPIVYTEHGFTARRRSDVLAWVKLGLKRRFLRKRVAAVAANSRFTANHLVEVLGISRGAVHVVHNGIDVSRIATPSGVDRHDRITLACVSRLVAWKRVDVAIAALAESGRTDMHLVIVGDGPERHELERQSNELQVADRVEFLGWREDVNSVLATADVLLHPGRDEWFGLAVLEATALGLRPIVLCDVGGALEILPPDGIVVDDAQGLSLALSTLQRDSSLGIEARRARGSWAKDSFPIEKSAEGYARLYDDAEKHARSVLN